MIPVKSYAQLSSRFHQCHLSYQCHLCYFCLVLHHFYLVSCRYCWYYLGRLLCRCFTVALACHGGNLNAKGSCKTSGKVDVIGGNQAQGERSQARDSGNTAGAGKAASGGAPVSSG